MDSLDILGHTFGRLGFVIGVGSGDYHDEGDGWGMEVLGLWLIIIISYNIMIIIIIIT